MTRFRHLSIRKKLLALFLTVIAFALLLSTTLFVCNDLRLFKKYMARDLLVLAKAVGANSRAALAFDDAPAAERILSSLKVEPQIDFAAIYKAEGLHAGYVRTPGMVFQPATSLEITNEDALFSGAFSGEYIEIVQPVELDGEIIGKIYLRANMGEFEDRIKSYKIIVGIIFTVTLLITFLLSVVFQGFVSNPILLLAKTVKEISHSQDFSVRVQHDSKDELGVLFAGFNEMLSQIKNRESALDKYQTQLEGLVKERTAQLEIAQKELLVKEKLATLGQLTAMVSHELRNPLGTIRNAIFLIANSLKEEDRELSTAVVLVETNIRRCDAIIEELLDYTRMKEPQLEPTDFDSWLDMFLHESRIPAGISLHKKINTGLRVFLDQEQFRRAMINVLQNAFQSIPERPENTGAVWGNVKVETVVSDSRLEVRIADDGVGIEPEKLQKVFEPLYSTKGFGVGLGLAIVKKTMEILNGGVEVESQLGAGTTFTLWLPRNQVVDS
jgi:signal transduction histidine kinase